MGQFRSLPLESLITAMLDAFREWVQFFNPPTRNATSAMRDMIKSRSLLQAPISTPRRSTADLLLHDFDNLDATFSIVLESTEWPEHETPTDCLPPLRTIEAKESNNKRVRSSQLFDSEGEPKSKKSKSVPSTRASSSAAAGPSSGMQRSSRIAGGSKKTT
ncbi:hypothetical protein DXG03_005351 [Asterophora parasitica]|uniref:Uncharacterized protein n=1 Tax=Asterophora parasitica TaxID=117018 RepID=A0A9P7K8Q9_9AGAR|nr:hypothetical protein DXG03_005351 [Asterophora parasitica]